MKKVVKWIIGCFFITFLCFFDKLVKHDNNYSTNSYYHVNTNINRNLKNINNSLTLEDIRKMNYKDVANLPIFDGRELGIVTPVKNQGSQGICWAYSLAAISETNMLYKNVLDSLDNNDSFQLSPKSIDFRANRRTEQDDKIGLSSIDTFKRDLGNGVADTFIPAGLMIQQNAPVINDDLNSITGKKPAWLTQVVSINNNVDEIKKAIAKYGAVSISYRDSRTDGKGNLVYYNSVSDQYTHAVAIVGWDDNVSKEKFHYNKPKNDGAWIVKNSWGSDVFDQGYFYLSYESLMLNIVAFDYEKVDTYENMYYYDGRGGVGQTPSIGKKKIGVIFPTKKSSFNTIEKLKGVTFAITGKNAKVKATIYKNVNANPNNRFSKINNPMSGQKVLEQESEIYENPDYRGGIYTMKLNEEIELEPNSYFSIILEATNDDNSAEILFSTEINSNNDLTFYLNDENKWNNCWLEEHSVAVIKGLTITEEKKGDKNNNLFYANVKLDSTKIEYLDLNKAQDININVEFDNKKLENNKDYKIEIETYLEPNETPKYEEIIGSLKVKVIGIGSYNGEHEAWISILKSEIPEIDFGKYEKNNDEKLIIFENIEDNFENQHTNIQYSDIKIKNWMFENEEKLINEGVNKNQIIYVGDDEKCFTNTKFTSYIIKVKTILNISETTFNPIQDYVYNGSEIKPSIELKYNEQNLIECKDYEVNYLNNLNAGIASIEIIGKNYFKDTRTINFEIKKAKNEITSFEFVDNNFKITSINGVENAKYIYFSDEKCLNKINGIPKENGTYYVKAFIPSSNNYEEVWSDKTLEIKINSSSNEETKPENKTNSNWTLIIILSTILPIGGIVIIIGGCLIFLNIYRKK